MAAIIISDSARAEIVAALLHTEQRFGREKRAEYELLIEAAFEQLAQFPQSGPARPRCVYDAMQLEPPSDW